MVVVLISALVLAKWDSATANPGGNEHFDPQLWIFITVVGACAVLALIGAVANFLLSSINPIKIPSTRELLYVRFLFAVLPILTTAITGLLDRSPHQFFRPSDVCFFSIAVSGPAILDLIHCRTKPAALRGLWSLPPLALIVWSSTLLGFWYFIRLVQVAPPNESVAPGVAIMEALRVNAVVSAILASAVAVGVQRQVSVQRRALEATSSSSRQVRTKRHWLV
jgi:hypothetical protein